MCMVTSLPLSLKATVEVKNNLTQKCFMFVNLLRLILMTKLVPCNTSKNKLQCEIRTSESPKHSISGQIQLLVIQWSNHFWLPFCIHHLISGTIIVWSVQNGAWKYIYSKPVHLIRKSNGLEFKCLVLYRLGPLKTLDLSGIWIPIVHGQTLIYLMSLARTTQGSFIDEQFITTIFIVTILFTK
jgi:hypothetical protein